MDVKKMTPLQAWSDFWEVVRPNIWPDLDRKDRRTLAMAQQDYEGGRKDRSGKAIALGDVRIERLLEKYGQGRYTFKRQMWVEVG